jgi:hypothetical protein
MTQPELAPSFYTGEEWRRRPVVLGLASVTISMPATMAGSPQLGHACVSTGRIWAQCQQMV